MDIETSVKKKKKRAANFTPRENNKLLSLISTYKHIIENKKTDAVSISDKNVVWQTITAQFNASCPEFVNRSTESLKKYYDNKKREIRKLKAEERKEVLLTGGGPPPRPDGDDHSLLLSVMDPLTVLGDKNTFDSDNIGINKNKKTNNVVSDDEVLCYELSTSDNDDFLNNNFMVSSNECFGKFFYLFSWNINFRNQQTILEKRKIAIPMWRPRS